MSNPRSPDPPPQSPSDALDSTPNTTPDPIAESSALQRASGLDRIRALGYLLDDAIPIPGTGYSFGLDPIVGLLPAGGDIVGTVLSAYIVLEAARFRLSVPTLTRMVFNILLETVVGTIPLIGDLFDVGWKANAKNLRLLESHLQDPTRSQAADQRFFIVVVLALGILIVLQIIWYIAVIRFLAHLFGN